MDACIIGVGNRWREDDGVGLVIVDKLKTIIPKEVIDFFYIEEQLFEIQSCFSCYKKLVILDALSPGAEPGKMKLRRINGSSIKVDNAYSLHDLDLLWQIHYAFVNGFTGELILIGIEVELYGIRRNS